jgi:alcohol dehydrogenase, propanol-preferring
VDSLGVVSVEFRRWQAWLLCVGKPIGDTTDKIEGKTNAWRSFAFTLRLANERNRAAHAPMVLDVDSDQRAAPMHTTMQAAQVEAFGKPLQLREHIIPTPGPGQILVQTEACGVCHTDLHAASGDWPLKPSLPFTPGHEGIGIVVALGAGVTAVKEGERVGVPWLYSACGHCEYCLAARETVCGEAQFGGYTKNGGFADYIIADPNYVAHIPARLSARDAAPLICAGITSYKGLKETRARPGEWVVVSGVGGLGHLAVQYAKAMGLQVCAVDVDDRKLEHAKRLGADALVNAKHGDPIAAVQSATSGGAHGVLITAPSLSAFKQGVGMTRKFGTCVLVGLPPGEFPTPLFDVVARCITIRGSFVGTRKDMAETLAFAADGKVKADIELQPLSAINSVLSRLAAGEVPSRVVLDFSTS